MTLVAHETKDPRFVRSGVPQQNINRLQLQDRAAHDWYRFVLSFPPHLVADYLHKFGVAVDELVLDPFCFIAAIPAGST